MRRILFWFSAIALVLIISWWFANRSQPTSGRVLDEARQAGRDPSTFPAADEDYFHGMDGPLSLSSEEIKGRNTWLVWTGGNDRLWDSLTITSAGGLDFLKVLSSNPRLPVRRSSRWEYLGLVNDPCYLESTGPDPERFGLWLDRRRPDCAPDPFENESKYPGVKVGARGRTVPVGSYYGYNTGVVGLRLFPNPDFNASAAAKWDAARYYDDPTYYLSRDLVRPYRVGMACAFCHVGPNPLKPPADPDHPQWENLSSNVGAQYFWVDRIFLWRNDPSNFLFQVLHTARPGTLDTSLISTDNINNPRSMNAVYLLGPRLQQARRWGKETLSGGGLNNRQINDYVKTGELTQFFEAPATVWTPRVLKDGADSAGPLAALNRVYLNIGTFSEEWLLHFNALIGGRRVTPIEIATCRKNSAYFAATEAQALALAQFFLKTTEPHHLSDAPGGDRYLTKDQSVLRRGKIVFAENCARCHSSKLPSAAAGLDPEGCAGKDYLACFNKYWAWTKTEPFKQAMRQIVLADDFLDGNYLSNDLRIPVTLLHTNACSPLATNAIGGNIWDNFSSQSYKDLPSVGEITWYHPVTGEPHKFRMPAGGRGYTRVPSLVSIWSTAPFLLNNSLGRFEAAPTVEARMRAFDDAIQQLLWPQQRQKDAHLGGKIPGMIDRTTERSFLRVATGYLPGFLRPLIGPGARHIPWLFSQSGIELGPIPAGTSVNLLASLNILFEDPDPSQRERYENKVFDLMLRMRDNLARLPKDASDEQARAILLDLVDPLLELSKCPDFVVNRGHYFGTGFVEPGETRQPEPGLSDQDKHALIEFLKTF